MIERIQLGRLLGLFVAVQSAACTFDTGRFDEASADELASEDGEVAHVESALKPIIVSKPKPPAVAPPVVTKPPAATQPVVTKPPAVTQPVVTKPPAATQPVVTNPPIVAQPVVTSPSLTKPDDHVNGLLLAPPDLPRTFESIVADFSGYDLNGDGIDEIESLGFLPGEETNPDATEGRVVVFYDPRLVADDPSNGVSSVQMRLHLALLRADLMSEGYQPHFVEAKLYRGERHQDGLTLLALRRLVKELHRHHRIDKLLLIGDFPESTIVLRVLARGRADTEEALRRFGLAQPVDYLYTGTVALASRSDLILSDLDGNWEGVYVAGPAIYRDAAVVAPPGLDFPVVGQTITSARYEVTPSERSDHFLVDDRSTTFSESAPAFALENDVLGPGTTGRYGSLTVHSLAQTGAELAPSDRTLPNPIARPEIAVSRINARHVALVPYVPDDASVDGQGPLAADGKPRTVRLSKQRWIAWREEPTLERKILTDYFYRNHLFRLGNDARKPFRTSAIRSDDLDLLSPVTFNALLRKADPGFTTPLQFDNAGLGAYVDFLQSTAVLRGVAAHANGAYTQFGVSDPKVVEAALGGRPWEWQTKQDAQGYYAEPGLAAGAEVRDAGYGLHRTLWENRVLESAGTGQAFYVHDGCEVNGGPGLFVSPYNSVNYAAKLQGEAVLFFANGLGVVARSKVFYDTPRGFSEMIAGSGRFSDGLQGYFEAEANDPGLNPDGTSNWTDRTTRILARKRVYAWGQLGDPTLRIRYPR